MKAVIVDGGAVIVVREPEIDVVMILPGAVIVVKTRTFEVTVTAGWVKVLVTRIVELKMEVSVIVEAGRVMVVRLPEMLVVTVDAG